jgi:PTS system nitrogen regulatory IIA component
MGGICAVPYTHIMVGMNHLSRILPAGNVILDLPATSKKRVFEQAGLLFENHHGLTRALVFDSLFARERLGSTALGHGVAVPHGRVKGLTEALAAFIRLAQPVPFDAPDGESVRLLLFLLVPESATQQHLDILAELAQLMSNKPLRQALLTEPDPVAVHRMLTTGELSPAAGSTAPAGDGRTL